MTTGDLRGLWKFRVGDYRVAYLIEDDRLVVLVVAAGDRKEIYDVIRRMRGRYGV
jgi:mRNA interferase RelE/StbE